MFVSIEVLILWEDRLTSSMIGLSLPSTTIPHWRSIANTGYWRIRLALRNHPISRHFAGHRKLFPSYWRTLCNGIIRLVPRGWINDWVIKQWLTGTCCAHGASVWTGRGQGGPEVNPAIEEIDNHLLLSHFSVTIYDLKRLWPQLKTSRSLQALSCNRWSITHPFCAITALRRSNRLRSGPIESLKSNLTGFIPRVLLESFPSSIGWGGRPIQIRVFVLKWMELPLSILAFSF